MKFHEYVTMMDSTYRRQQYAGRKRIDPDAFYKIAAQQAARQSKLEPLLALAMATENVWYRCTRPYYKAWPAIIKALGKIKLDVCLGQLELPDQTIMLIRFAEGHESDAGPCGGICSILVGYSVGMMFINVKTSADHDVNGGAAMLMFAYMDDSKETLETEIGAATWDWQDRCEGMSGLAKPPISDSRSIQRLASQIAITTLLLSDNPEVITPEVLAADRGRYETETDEAWKERAVERAKRRGVVGWNVGASYDVSPHLRNRHLHLYHTGKGRTVPRIVLVKECVVHRSKLTEVPTGYILPDGTEVEGGSVANGRGL